MEAIDIDGGAALIITEHISPVVKRRKPPWVCYQDECRTRKAMPAIACDVVAVGRGPEKRLCSPSAVPEISRLKATVWSCAAEERSERERREVCLAVGSVYCA
ncbi:hypothetical protein F2P81_018736 [Scophthalmus maximus]|uniref:Uncharacterized protein n=1 Tax=Scophthalmus maximus TaxID=52904 RepID=A0A6A4SEQ4_SCOMX|nr:hypothetical protein F2P81_018736 [Scophthalmus maximus]